MQKLQSSSMTETRRNLDIPIYGGGAGQMGAPVYNSSPESHRRPGIPPSHPNNHSSLQPYSQMMMMPSRSSSNSNSNHNAGPSHYRSLSQPSAFDFLPPLSPTNPLTYRESSVGDPSLTNVSVEERAGNSHGLSVPSSINRVSASKAGESFPPRKGHRRSISDTPLGFSAMIQSSPQLIPIGSRGVSDISVSMIENQMSKKLSDISVSGIENQMSKKPIQLVKRESQWADKDGKDNVQGMEERKSDGEMVDDLINAYMNLDNIDTLNSSGTEDKDMDSKASGTKTNGGESSDNEVESGVNRNSLGLHGASSSMCSERREGVKRSAGGGIAPTARHYRSVSMDSYMESLDFDDDTARLPMQTQADQILPGTNTPIDRKLAKLSLEFNGEFNEAELNKILANDKLAEIALSDPKRAKRILANRQSAARSKERKMRYIAELEQKVQTLQTEATTLSAQVTVLQRDATDMTSQNNELKFRLQAMDQQAHLKDALNEALAAEVQRLKATSAEINGEINIASALAHQLSINTQMLQRQHQQHQQQSNQLNLYQLQERQQQPQSNQLQPNPQNGEAANPK